MRFPLPFLSVGHIAPIELIRAYHQSQIFQNENKIEYMYPPICNYFKSEITQIFLLDQKIHTHVQVRLAEI